MSQIEPKTDRINRTAAAVLPVVQGLHVDQTPDELDHSEQEFAFAIARMIVDAEDRAVKRALNAINPKAVI